jgi:hypothetical protein
MATCEIAFSARIFAAKREDDTATESKVGMHLRALPTPHFMCLSLVSSACTSRAQTPFSASGVAILLV